MANGPEDNTPIDNKDIPDLIEKLQGWLDEVEEILVPDGVVIQYAVSRDYPDRLTEALRGALCPLARIVYRIEGEPSNPSDPPAANVTADPHLILFQVRGAVNYIVKKRDEGRSYAGLRTFFRNAHDETWRLADRFGLDGTYDNPEEYPKFADWKAGRIPQSDDDCRYRPHGE